MNEQIRQLAEQAGVDYDLRPEIARAPVWIGTDEELERFAQLIAEECAQDFDKTYMTGGETVGNYIRRKFGVEE